MTPVDSVRDALISISFLSGFVAAFVLPVVGIIMALVYASAKAENRPNPQKMLKEVLRAYFVIATYVTAILASLGFSYLFQVIFGAIFPVATYGFRGVDNELRQDLVQGVTLTFVSLLLFLLHVGIGNVVKVWIGVRDMLLNRAIVVVSLFLVVIPYLLGLYLGISQMMSLLVRTNTSATPSGYFALILGFGAYTVYTVYFIVDLLKEKKN